MQQVILVSHVVDLHRQEISRLPQPDSLMLTQEDYAGGKQPVEDKDQPTAHDGRPDTD
jgi:hypothetical protein